MVAGAVCAAVIVNEVGEILALVMVGLGVVGLTGLVFLEVGLSEDRARERERRRAERLEHPERPRRFHSQIRGRRRRP